MTQKYLDIVKQLQKQGAELPLRNVYFAAPSLALLVVSESLEKRVRTNSHESSTVARFSIYDKKDEGTWQIVR